MWRIRAADEKHRRERSEGSASLSRLYHTVLKWGAEGGVGGVRDIAVSCPLGPPPGPSAAFLQEIRDRPAVLHGHVTNGDGGEGGGAPIRKRREATSRRVWTLERYKETCVNSGGPHTRTQGKSFTMVDSS